MSDRHLVISLHASKKWSMSELYFVESWPGPEAISTKAKYAKAYAKRGFVSCS